MVTKCFDGLISSLHECLETSYKVVLRVELLAIFRLSLLRHHILVNLEELELVSIVSLLDQGP